MLEDIENPQAELVKINKVIRQYEGIYKTTVNLSQKERVGKQLKSLKQRKEQILSVFELEDPGTKDSVPLEEEAAVGQEYSFLAYIHEQTKRNKTQKADIFDEEVYNLECYFKFFDEQFLTVFSERRLKLDFKYSIERDSFYYKFKDLQRTLEDFHKELKSVYLREYRNQEEIEAKNRILKRKRLLFVEVNRFYETIEKFTFTLLEDIEKDGSKCLNSDDEVTFDAIEGDKYLLGYTVQEALNVIREICVEIIDFLNIPQIDVQE